RRDTGSRDSVRARGQHPHFAQPQFWARNLSRRSRRGSCRRHARVAADDRQHAHYAKLCRNHNWRSRQPAGHLAGRIVDRRRLRNHGGVLPLRERSGDLRAYGTCPAGPAARSIGRGGTLLVNRLGRRGPGIAVWLLLLALPYWVNWGGGYTSFGNRVLLLGPAAISLNFFFGFPCALSFGHAAYFGLGVYGVGLTIKYLAPSTLLGIAVGVVAGAIAAALIGLLIVRLRGIYFAMVTIAFGQVFYFIAYRWNSVTGGDD